MHSTDTHYDQRYHRNGIEAGIAVHAERRETSHRRVWCGRHQNGPRRRGGVAHSPVRDSGAQARGTCVVDEQFQEEVLAACV